jgi:hypothetical protein
MASPYSPDPSSFLVLSSDPLARLSGSSLTLLPHALLDWEHVARGQRHSPGRRRRAGGREGGRAGGRERGRDKASEMRI